MIHSPATAADKKTRQRSSEHPGPQRLGNVRTPDGVLVIQVSPAQALELQRRGLIEPRGRRHYLVLFEHAPAVRLWARSRTGGSDTTIGIEKRGQVHRALKRMLL